MTDLTKILKVGDKVESYRYGEGEVSKIKTPSNKAHYCIQVILPNGVNAQWYLLDGRLTRKSLRPDLLPLGMEIPPPQWPELPKTFEWGGEIYTEGEWVAVRIGIIPFEIRILQSVNDSDHFPIKCDNNSCYNQMRKLSSFNQPEPTRRKEKEDALTEYLHEEYDIVLGSRQISEIFHLIEKK